MKMLMKGVLGVFILMIGLSQAGQASEVEWKLSSEYISNLDATLAEAKSKIIYTRFSSGAPLPSDLFVAFPAKIPFSGLKAYANFITLKAGDSYAIEVANKPACEMSKSCLSGSLMLQWKANPTIYYDSEDKQATLPLVLHHGIQGFYTHGFAMADFWPARLEWRYKEVLYTLSWANQESQQVFVQMANSVIDQLYKR